MKQALKLTLAEIQAMSVAERYALMQDCTKLAKKVESTRDEYRTVSPVYGKVVAELKRDYARLISDKNSGLAPDTSFKDFFAQNCGGKLPGRLETLAAFFNTMVFVEDGRGKPLLAEEYYDEASVNSLEIANKCINHAKAAALESRTDWRGHNDTLDVINALSKPGDATKKLKAIRSRQNPKSADADGENAVQMTPQLAAQYLIAALKAAGEQPEDKAYDLCCLVFEVNTAWAENSLSEETRNAFDKRYADAMKHGVAPHVEVKSEALAA
jgi:hypothetical protein